MKTFPCLTGPAVRAVRAVRPLALALLAAVGVMLSAPQQVQAQTATGTILGNVKDTSGARRARRDRHRHQRGHAASRARPRPTPTASTRCRCCRSATTRSRSRSTGFKNFSQTGILLEVGRNARVDATIEPGDVAEVVSVVADAPLVETNIASLSRTVGQNEVLNLPLVNRDLYSLLSITGGVTSNDNSNSLGGPEQLTTINGSQNAQIGTVNFQLDGGNNTAGLRGTGNPAPNPEAVQEFRVITNSYAAEYGRYPAGVVDVVTKSGTNQFHGARVRVLPQREAEREALGAARRGRRRRIRSIATSTARRSAGRSRKDKTFFFASYSGLRQEETYYRNTRGRADGARARRRLLAVGDQAARSGDERSRSPATSSPRRASMPAALTIQDRFVPAVEPAEQLLRSEPARSARDRRGDAQARSSALADAHARGQLLLPEGHRHAAAVADRATSRGSIATSSGRSTTSTSPTPGR